jgi:ABC-type lipoprotein release transport system permease subunit
MRIFLTVMALMTLLAACDGQKKDVKDTVFGSQVQMKNKARAVENTLRQGADKEREAIESSEKPGEPEQK